jgi:hypothetical protein
MYDHHHKDFTFKVLRGFESLLQGTIRRKITRRRTHPWPMRRMVWSRVYLKIWSYLTTLSPIGRANSKIFYDVAQGEGFMEKYNVWLLKYKISWYNVSLLLMLCTENVSDTSWKVNKCIRCNVCQYSAVLYTWKLRNYLTTWMQPHKRQ